MRMMVAVLVLAGVLGCGGYDQGDSAPTDAVPEPGDYFTLQWTCDDRLENAHCTYGPAFAATTTLSLGFLGGQVDPDSALGGNTNGFGSDLFFALYSEGCVDTQSRLFAGPWQGIDIYSDMSLVICADGETATGSVSWVTPKDGEATWSVVATPSAPPPDPGA